ncbi:MAG: histidine triad nucleotide-binding protein [Rickettsiales bacterium]|nr:histidine triad nucleotide-binding protein [Rickettsiales bacterium]
MIDIDNYDNQNVFAKILRKEIPSEKVFEDSEIYAFKDISPQAPFHILVVPKQAFCSLDDFLNSADDKIILNFFKKIKKIVNQENLKDGYRLITNVGKFGGQEVPHLHFHILSGRHLGRLVP